MISIDELVVMKKGPVLINTSRGTVVDYTAVASALLQGQLAGVAADVFPEEPASAN